MTMPTTFRYSRPETPIEKAARIAKAKKAAAAIVATAPKPIDPKGIAKEAAKLIPVPKDGEAGKDGVRGSLWHFGIGEPGTIAYQADGDFYLETVTSDVYALDFGGWVFVGNIRGEPGKEGKDGERGSRGPKGADGSMWLEGPRDPKKDDGKDSDLWLNRKTLDLFQKKNGAWHLVANIRGKQGFAGARGKDGLIGSGGSGSDAATILTGSGPPPSGGVVGQHVLTGSGPPS
jgi:hypothetical protein